MEKQKILIADDARINQDFLTEILGSNYEYLYADDGVQLIEMLSCGADVDLILLDIHMPHMNGFDVLKRMNERHWIEEVPVIVISAEQDSGYVQRAFDLGATDYISRPFHPALVERRVSNTLTMCAHQRKLTRLGQEIQCLKEEQEHLRVAMREPSGSADERKKAPHFATEIPEQKSLLPDDRTRLLYLEQTKKEFFAKQCGGIQFEYNHWMGKVLFTNWYADPAPQKKTLYLSREDDVSLLTAEDWVTLRNRLKKTTVENPTVEMEVLIPVRNKYRWHRLTARSVWYSENPDYIGAIGQFTDIHEEVLRRGLEAVQPEGNVTLSVLQTLQDIFEVVRLVDPDTSCVLELNGDGMLKKTGTYCYELWGRCKGCENCSSAKAKASKNWTSKLEVRDGKMYSVLSKYLQIGQQNCVMEIAFCMDENPDASTLCQLPREAGSLLLNLYRDALTNAYSRMYLNHFLPNLEHADGVAIIDVDKLKQANDTYGHLAGDQVLMHVAKIIFSRVRETDTLIRYGGDEFLLIFSKIPEKEFYNRLDQIRTAVHTSALKEYPELRLDISIGGAYQVYPLEEAITAADKKMYEDKTRSQSK